MASSHARFGISNNPFPTRAVRPWSKLLRGWWKHHLWKCSRDTWGCVSGLIVLVGLGDLEGLFQRRWSRESGTRSDWLHIQELFWCWESGRFVEGVGGEGGSSFPRFGMYLAVPSLSPEAHTSIWAVLDPWCHRTWSVGSTGSFGDARVAAHSSRGLQLSHSPGLELICTCTMHLCGSLSIYICIFP